MSVCCRLLSSDIKCRMERAGHFFRLAGLLFIASLVYGQQSSSGACRSCPGSSGPTSATSCCGNIGCCTPSAYSAWSGATAGLRGTCRDDFAKVFGQCTSTVLSCMSSGESISACYNQLFKSCVALQSCAASSVRCNMSVTILLGSKSYVVPECVPKTCLNSGQLKQATQNLYTLLCSAASGTLCPVSSLQLQCAGKVKISCAKKETISCYELTSSSSTNTAPASSVCTFNGQTHKCPLSPKSPNTACCSMSGQFLGCCRPDVQSFLADLFSSFDQKCRSDFTSSEFFCYKKLVACQDQLISTFRGRTQGQLTIQNITSLAQCNVLSSCTNSSIKAGSNCSTTQRLCSISYRYLLPTFMSRSFAQSGYMCLPKTCADSKAEVAAVSKVVYTSMCYPMCALTGSFKRLTLPLGSLSSLSQLIPGGLSSVVKSLQSTGCFVKTVTVTCGNEGLSSTYSPSGDECPDIDITLPFGYPSSGGSNYNKNKDSSSSSSSSHTLVYAMTAVGGALIITGIVLAVIFYKRRQRTLASTSQTYGVLQEEEEEE